MENLPLESIAIAAFISSCEESGANLSNCEIYREIDDDATAILVVNTCERKEANDLWRNRKILAGAAVRLNLAQKTLIKYQGKLFRPPFDVHVEYGVQIVQSPILSESETDGDLAKRILDCGVSAALVDFLTNRLIASSKQIVSSSGRDWFFMVTEGQDMNAMWAPSALYDLNRDLRQEGRLTDYVYSAYTWVQEGGIWIRAERQFKADLFEVVPFYSRACRLSMGVEII